MRTLNLILTVFMAMLLFTQCDKSNDAVTDTDEPDNPIIEKRDLSGLIEKGPFVSGSTVTISELDEKLIPTGRTFTTQTTSNDGAFAIKGIDFVSNYVEIAVDGFFFDEIKGDLSTSKITLMGLADITNRATVNVNLLTHMQRLRVRKLVEDGQSFADAKKNSLKDILNAFSVEGDFEQPENFSITGISDESSILLAITTIMLNGNGEAKFTEFLSQFLNDLKDDGVITDETIKSKIAYNSSQLRGLINQVKENIRKRYQELGKDITIGKFEDFVDFDNDGILNKDDNDGPKLITTQQQLNDTLAKCYDLTYEYTRLNVTFNNILTGESDINNAQWNSIKDHNFSSSDLNIKKLWDNGYEIVYKANNILESIESISMEQTDKDAFYSEALVIRSMALYRLKTLFGNIPLLTESYAEAMNDKSRNTIDEVNAFVEKDLMSAIAKLSNEPGSDKSKISIRAAQVLLAKLYAEQEKWQDASYHAEKIINSGNYSLTPDYDNAFTDTSLEIIFGVTKGDNAIINAVFTKGAFIPVFRYAEVLMISAESAYRMGDLMKAMMYMNQLLERRNQNTLVSLENNSLLNLYKDEFSQEGEWFATLKRLNAAQNVLGLSDHQLVLPIPQSVFENTQFIIQNPGY